MREGTLVGDRFEIEQLAGRGGMGAVYRARDRSTGGVAAVKILHDDAAPNHRERFAREAKIYAELTHPAFVRYLGFGQVDTNTNGLTKTDARLYLAMEWLEGEDLSTRLKRVGLTPNETVQMAARIAAALGAAHARGIVHRDIKPSNLFLVDRDLERVKVLDFGIARIQAADAMTRTGNAIGTPRYMAPEQARGSRDLDARADVYSLGCVVYECLAGKSAFVGDSPAAILAKILLEEAPQLRAIRKDLAPALEDLVGRMLAKDVAVRPRDGTAVATELSSLGDVGGGTEPVSRLRPSAVSVGEQRLVCVVFAAGALELELGSQSGEQTAHDDHTSVDGEASATITLAKTVGGKWRALSAAIAEHGGRAEVLADGSVIVTVFGTGVATDQAARAARCALAMRSVVPSAAMALAIGRCVVGDRLPLGELIDRTTGMLRQADQLATPGIAARPIRVDEVAAGLLDVRFAIDGDEHGLVLFGERDVADLTRTLLGKPTPCVGRDRELAALTATYQECVEAPRAHAVVVTGAAGVGKSRVRYELLRRIGGSAEVWIGRGDSISAGAPFGLIAQALRRSAGIVDGEPASVRHLKLKARVSRHVVASDTERVTEFLGELVGAPLPLGGSVQLLAARGSPELLHDQMVRACEDFIAAECDAGPVVIVLEDLQWGDLPTVRALDSVLRHTPDKPLMILALARPDVDAVFPRLWADRGAERIHLGELTRKAGESLVRSTLGEGTDPALVAKLIDRAAGNAFYLEELIRSVAEGYGDRLPETILAMAQARIEALDVEARHVLRAASVFGQVFWRGGVQRLLEGGSTQVRDWLVELTERELVSARRTSRFADEDEYTFRHSLIREAAYAMLPDRDRMQGHRLAGKWLEARVAAPRGERSEREGEQPRRIEDDVAEVDAVALAEHFFLSNDLRRAVAWYRQAAEQAIEGDDLASAIDRAERAIACVRGAERPEGELANDPDDDRLVGQLRQLQASAHVWRGEYALAIERGDEALERLIPATPTWFVAAAAVADARTRRLEHDSVIELCRVLGAVGVVPDAYRVYAHAVTITMPTLLWHGGPELADRLFARLDEIEPACSDPAALAWIYTARSWRAMSVGDLAACLALHRSAEECFRTVGDLRQACQQRAHTGYHELVLGGAVVAETSLREAMAVATRIGLHQVTSAAQHNLGLALAYQGRLDEAREVETAARDAFVTQENRRLGAAACNYLAMIEIAAGNHAAALAHARAAVETGSDMGSSLCQFHGTLSNAHRAAGDLESALAAATTAMRYIETHGRPEEGEITARLAYAEALHASGRLADAARAIAEVEARVHEDASKIGDPAWRESFLRHIPENARTITLARQWGDQPRTP